MNHLHVQYLLVGAGLAAGSAAEAIRRIDPAGTMLMVGQEINRPYHRTPLSKDFLQHRSRHDDLFMHTDQWFAENRVQLRTGRRIERLNAARHSVTLGSGEEVSYDKLLLATGASPKHLEMPGADLPNLFYLRTVADVDRLGNAIEKARHDGKTHAKGRGRVAVIGGGVLGVELAGSLQAAGLQVDLIVGHPHPWFRFAGITAGNGVARILESAGVVVHNDRRAVALEGDGRVQRVRMDNQQQVDCDFAVEAVGSVVNRSLLRGTAIAAEKAILTDARCCTSDPNIYAAGDCAAIFDPLFGKHRLIDHAAHAAAAGAIAGENMAGGNATFNMVNSWTTGVLAVKATIFGEPRLVDRRVVRGGGADNLAEFGIASDNRVAAVLALGMDHDFDALRQLVAGRMVINQVNGEGLKDPAVPLKDLLA